MSSWLDRIRRTDGASRRNVLIALGAVNIVLIAVVVGILVGGGFFGGDTTTALNESAPRVDTVPPAAPAPAPSQPAEQRPRPSVAAPQPTPESAPAPDAPPPQVTGETAQAVPPMRAPGANRAVRLPATGQEGAPEPPPAEDAGEDAPLPGEDAPEPINMDAAMLLSEISIGMTYNQLASLLGADGVPSPDAGGPFHPVGWYRYSWPHESGGYLNASFDDRGQLMVWETVNMPGAEVFLDEPLNKIPLWLNEQFSTSGIPVRVAAAAFTGNGTEFNGILVDSSGQLVGEVRGIFYSGDAVTTVAPGDTRAYQYAIEGEYQFFGGDGTEYRDAFAFTEY